MLHGAANSGSFHGGTNPSRRAAGEGRGYALSDEEHPDYLALPGLRFIRRERKRWKDGTQYWQIECESVDPQPPIHRCRAPNVHPFGYKIVKLAHTPDGTTGREIAFRRRRWCCWGCDYTGLYEPIPQKAPNRRMTLGLFDYIIQQVPDTGFRKISRLTHVSEGTIRNVFKDVMRAYDRRPIKAPLIICLDEKHLIKGRKKAFGVATDGDGGKLMNILPDNTKRFRAYLETLTHRHRVKVITIDMTPRYKNWAEELFENAVVIADKWHVQRRADLALDDFRRHLADEDERLTGRRSTLRNHTKALLSHWPPKKLRTHLRLASLFRRWPKLEEAYHIKEDWYAIYDMADGPWEAGQMFDTWRNLLPEDFKPWFGKVMFQNRWREHVLAYFDWEKTNAPAESMNSKIGEHWWVGRSFSLDVLRAKLMLDPSDYPMPEARPVARVRKPKPDAPARIEPVLVAEPVFQRLTLTGGGIRTACFALGVLAALGSGAKPEFFRR